MALGSAEAHDRVDDSGIRTVSRRCRVGRSEHTAQMSLLQCAESWSAETLDKITTSSCKPLGHFSMECATKIIRTNKSAPLDSFTKERSKRYPVRRNHYAPPTTVGPSRSRRPREGVQTTTEVERRALAIG
jgi:hypothetical protein